MHIRINRLPGHPIVEALGLKVKCVQSGGGSVWDTLQPIRPFWMHVAVREELGQTIAVVTGTEKHGSGDRAANPTPAERRNWHFHRWLQATPASTRQRGTRPRATKNPADVPYFAAPGRTRVGASLVDQLADGNAQEMRDVAKGWLRRSLTYQLAVLRVRIDALLPENASAVEKFSKIADAALRRRADQLCRANGRKAFRLACDALSEADATSLAQAIEAALETAKAPPRMIVTSANAQRGRAADPNSFAFEPRWYSPEWAAYALREKIEGSGWESYQELNRPPKIATDGDPLLKDIQTIVQWIMQPAGTDHANWTDVISTRRRSLQFGTCRLRCDG